MEQLPRVAANDRRLNHLSLASRSLTTSQLDDLTKAMKRNTNVRVLDLSENWIGSEGIRMVGRMLASNKNVGTILLHGNAIGDSGMEYVVSALKIGERGPAPFSSLDLSLNDIGSNGVRILSDALASGAAPLLTELNLSENWIADDGAGYLLSLISKRRGLLEVNVAGNKASAAPLAEITAKLEENRAFHRDALLKIEASGFSDAAIRDALDDGFAIMGRCPELIGTEAPALHWIWEQVMQHEGRDVETLTTLLAAIGPSLFDIADHRHRSVAEITAVHYDVDKFHAITQFVDDQFGIPQIHLASAMDWPLYVRALVALRPNDAYLKTSDTLRTPLHTCLVNKSLDSAAVLIPLSDLDEADVNGNTALHIACSNLCSQVVPLLIKNQCAVDVQNNSRQTALHIAVEKAMLGTVEELLAAGAHLCHGYGGDTPIHIAAGMPYSPIIDILVAKCPKKMLDSVNKRSRSALHLAVRANNAQAARLLLSAGASARIGDHRGKLPFDYARSPLHGLLLETRSPAPRLKDLEVRNLGLTHLPTAVEYWESFSRLASLDVRDNLLDSLPAALLNVPALLKIETSGNPFAKLPKLKKSEGNWKSALKSMATSKAASSWKQAQVFLLGSNGAGKSALMSYLSEGSACIKNAGESKNSGSQPHIFRQQAQLTDIRLNMTEICSDPAAVYCCEVLMAGGGIFLIAVDASQEDLTKELASIEHWLQFAGSIMPRGRARAIVVATHMDSTTARAEVLAANKATLQTLFKESLFPCLQCIAFVGILKGDGMKQFQSRLVGLAASMCDALPISYEWKLIAGAVRSSITKPFLTYAELQEVALENNVEGTDVPIVLSQLQSLGYLFAEPELRILVRDSSPLHALPPHYFLLLDPGWFSILLSQVVPLKFNLSGNRSGRKEDAGVVNSSCLGQLQVLEPQLFPSADASVHLQVLQRFRVAVPSKDASLASSSSSGTSSLLLVPSLVPKALDDSQKQRMAYLLNNQSSGKPFKQLMCFEVLPVPFSFIGSLFCKLYILPGVSVLFHWRTGFLLDVNPPTASDNCKVLVELLLAEGRNLVNQLKVSSFGSQCPLVFAIASKHSHQHCANSARRFDTCLHCLNDGSVRSGHQFYEQPHRFTERELEHGTTGLCRGIRPVSFTPQDDMLFNSPVVPVGSYLKEKSLVKSIEKLSSVSLNAKSGQGATDSAPFSRSIHLIAEDAVENPCKALLKIKTSITSIVRPSKGDASRDSLFVGCSDGTIRRYCMAPNAKAPLGVALQEEDSWAAHSRAVREIAWIGSRLVSISLDGKVRCWKAIDAQTHELAWEAACLRENECVSNIGDGVFCTIAPSERSIRLWCLETGQLVRLVDLPIPVGEERPPHVTCVRTFGSRLAVAAGRYLFLFDREDFYCCGYWKLASDTDRRLLIKLMAATPSPTDPDKMLLWVALGSRAVALSFTSHADEEEGFDLGSSELDCCVQYVVSCGSPIQLINGHPSMAKLVIGMKSGALLSLALREDSTFYCESLLLDEERREVPKHGLLFATTSEPPYMVLVVLSTECLKADKSVYNRVVATALA